MSVIITPALNRISLASGASVTVQPAATDVSVAAPDAVTVSQSPTTINLQSAGPVTVTPTTTPVTVIAANSPTPTAFAWNEIPGGPVDDANRVYTLAHTPVTGSLQLYVNGLLQVSGDDFTLSGNVITFAAALLTATQPDALRASYVY